MLDRHINIGKIRVPVVALIIAALIVVLLVVVLVMNPMSQDSTTDAGSTPTPTATPDNGEDITQGGTGTPTPPPQQTPPSYNSESTGLFDDFKADAEDYLAGLEASSGDTYSGKQITGPMTYRNSSIRKAFTINGECGPMGISIVECDDYTKILQKNYTEEYFNDGYCYGMYFDDPNGLLTAGEYAINDQWFEHVVIQDVEGTTNKLVVFRCRVPMVFVTVAHNLQKQTIISAYERPDHDQQVVFIDPYYGGVNDQGGWRSNIAVCQLNLNIALRTNSLLRDEDCTVYLSRDLDEYVGAWERIYLAEAVNADLYISITFGSSQTDTSLKGTQIIYDSVEDSSTATLNGKVLAQILSEKIPAAIGTENKGILPVGIAPYRYTSIPTAMAEIGYISNDEEFFQIIKEDFQYNTAVALKDSIISALELLED